MKIDHASSHHQVEDKLLLISIEHRPIPHRISSFLHLVPTLKTVDHPHLIRKPVIFPLISFKLRFHHMDELHPPLNEQH